MVFSTVGTRTAPRPGGRSARVQEAVHRAARELTAELGREALTVPMIATRAGVTPSTIYRRWGDLAELLADVSVERMRPEGEPADTGSLRGDLLAWAEQYNEEMSSQPGQGMLRDVLSAQSPDDRPSCRCAGFVALQIGVLLDRARTRGEATPPVDRVMDMLVAPLLFRLLFTPAPATADEIAGWIDASLATAGS
ncbi:TetR/AcrR family transcriptional regulator [Pseudacidovorax intermedius]|uniref:TetR family transcriptional regulator n=1 Tax=Pseudacidovorax intermedius TaxID=433924 RepID=A0A147GLR8_9BURK|nr:TetR/AcrR family transcriptional regulator [Pseudacidovorax intermedius]KTT14530.1 TetR family transcriptional regulator [Pseudacidovorax intermedius]